MSEPRRSQELNIKEVISFHEETFATATGDKRNEHLIPSKNTYDDFKGVQLSNKYDFDPDKHKYAQEPPKAGAGKNAAKTDTAVKKTDAAKTANQKVDDHDPNDDTDSEEIDVNAVKKKVLKVKLNHEEQRR